MEGNEKQVWHEYITGRTSGREECYSVQQDGKETVMKYVYEAVLAIGGLLLAVTGCGGSSYNMNVGASYLPFENDAEITVGLNVCSK